MKLVRYADRPDLLEIRWDALASKAFPEYMNHNEPGRNWGRLYTDFPDFQVGLLDDDGTLVAEAHAIPVPWDGTTPGLPSGWDEGFEAGMAGALEPTALMAIAIAVLPSRQGQRLSSRMIETFTDTARAAGLAKGVIAPVRPTWKERYPLIPIEEYMTWRRDDGSHFDPWLRIHERVGGEILAAAPRSMVVRGTAEDWEEWTQMPFPGDGDYVFPGCLAPVSFAAGVGTHVEPNVWVHHRV